MMFCARSGGIGSAQNGLRGGAVEVHGRSPTGSGVHRIGGQPWDDRPEGQQRRQHHQDGCPRTGANRSACCRGYAHCASPPQAKFSPNWCVLSSVPPPVEKP